MGARTSGGILQKQEPSPAEGGSPALVSPVALGHASLQHDEGALEAAFSPSALGPY